MEPGETDWLAALVRSAAATVDGIVCIDEIDTALKGGYVSSGGPHAIMDAPCPADSRLGIKAV
jgi:hypothetical protein